MLTPSILVVDKMQIPAEEKQKLGNEIIKWMAEDCRPFSAINGAGFKNLVQVFIQIGAKFGENIDIEDMLPDETTVSRNLQVEANKKKQELAEEIKNAVSEGKASITTDLWTDNDVKRTFLGATIHYEKDTNLVNRVLGVKSMDFERRKHKFKTSGNFGQIRRV